MYYNAPVHLGLVPKNYDIHEIKLGEGNSILLFDEKKLTIVGSIQYI